MLVTKELIQSFSFLLKQSRCNLENELGDINSDFDVCSGGAVGLLLALDDLKGDELLLIGVPLPALSELGRLDVVSVEGSKLGHYLSELPESSGRFNNIRDLTHQRNVNALFSGNFCKH
jgi:hypothetical protein